MGNTPAAGTERLITSGSGGGAAADGSYRSGSSSAFGSGRSLYGNVAGGRRRALEDSDVQEVLTSIANDVMQQFTPLYIAAYSTALISRLEMEVTPPASRTTSLLPVPIPSDPIAQGWLTKQGAKTKSWKRRYFVAANRAENYAVYYYDREEHKDDPTKAKGRAELCGYTVKRVKDEAEQKTYGEFCLRLSPCDSSRRTWYVRASNEEERTKWKAIFQFQARNAAPELSIDPVLRTAFVNAYWNTRVRAGLFAHTPVQLPECSQLVELVFEAQRQSFDESAVSESALKSARAAAQAIVTKGWQQADSVVLSNKDMVERHARASLKGITDQQEVFRRQMKEATHGQARVIIVAVLEPAAVVVGMSFGFCLYKALRQTVKVFHDRMRAVIREGVREADIRFFSQDVRWTWGVLGPAYAKIRVLTRGGSAATIPGSASIKAALKAPVPDLLRLLPGVPIRYIETLFSDAVRVLAERAIFTFAMEMQGDARAEATRALVNVVTRLIADCKVTCRNTIDALLKHALMPEIRRRCSESLAGQLELLGTQRPEGLRPFLCVDTMFNVQVEGAVNEYLATTLHEQLTPVVDQLDKQPRKLGLASGK